MLGTVRTSIGNRSAEGLDDPSFEGERERFEEFSLVLDENPAVMSRERGHDVLPFQFSADEVFGPVELDSAMGVDVVMINELENSEMKYLIITGGKLIFEREPYKVLVEPRILHEYFDFREMLLRYNLTS